MDNVTRLLMQGAAGAGKKTYVDDVFSTYLWKGNETARSINNGIDLSGKGGLVWTKNRDQGTSHRLFDTERGVNKEIRSNSNNAEATDVGTVTAFNNNGFSLGTDDGTNWDTKDYSSWTFRKAPGFFDIVTYTGTGSAQTLAHGLGSVPGCIMIKRLDVATHDWAVYHSALTAGDYLKLNSTAAAASGNNRFDQGVPTATNFAIGTSSDVNANGGSYVAYLWAGGESTNALARSVDMDGTGDYINTTSSSSDFTMGTGDFTVECWVKWDGGAKGIFQISPTSGGIQGQPGFTDTMCLWIDSDSKFNYQAGGTKVAPVKIQEGQWTHVAYVRNSGTTSLYVNGTLAKSDAHTTDLDGTYVGIGGYWDTGYLWDGKISNFRVVKGTAVYTSSFRPPTEPLANITGTVLLCCNDSSVTGSTVTPVTLNSQGDPTASIDSPFDDPAGYKFGEGGDQNIIKCGKITTDTSNGAILNLPWEPQYILYKHANANVNWVVLDVMRGWTADGTVEMLYPNLDNAESAGGGYEELGARTIKFQGYGNNYEFIYMVIRRPDGLVGRPVEVGTDSFAMDTGSGSSDGPTFDSGFPVDFAIRKQPTVVENNFTMARLMGLDYLSTNTTNAEAGPASNFASDYNTGWAKVYASSYQSWMWKRGQGFDVVCYSGQSEAKTVPHSLNKIPEMIWIKHRTGGSYNWNWVVGHKGLNGGTNPWHYYLTLNNSDQEVDNANRWNDTAPTSSVFTIGDVGNVNEANSQYIAMLFASVDGISKCGYYAGSNAVQTITTGFQPRFVIIRNITESADWWVLDTLRGWGAGNDQGLRINADNAQYSFDFGAGPTSTGFSLVGNDASVNAASKNYIYYAHA